MQYGHTFSSRALEAHVLGSRARDERHNAMLTAMGWNVIEIWECETADADPLAKKIRGFLG